MFNRVFNFEKNRNLTNHLPQMNKPIEGWSVPITLLKITQGILNGKKTEKTQEITFSGTVQPFTAEKLSALPEGMRSWSWIWIHCVAGSLNLQTQDKIIFNNVRYKVMSIKDYSLYNYIEYELCQDYQV